MFTNELSGLYVPFIIFGIILGVILTGIGVGGCELIHKYKISVEKRQSHQTIVTNTIYVTNTIVK